MCKWKSLAALDLAVIVFFISKVLTLKEEMARLKLKHFSTLEKKASSKNLYNH